MDFVNLSIKHSYEKAKWYKFRQNNSYGEFKIDDDKGLGPTVFIEAFSINHACNVAESLGIYFDGVSNDIDCPCCGDRWSRPLESDASDELVISKKYDFFWHKTVYVHRLDSTDGVKLIKIENETKREKLND